MSSNVSSTEEPPTKDPYLGYLTKTKQNKQYKEEATGIIPVVPITGQTFSRYFVPYWEFLRHLKMFMYSKFSSDICNNVQQKRFGKQ
jgi:hypothetical protein